MTIAFTFPGQGSQHVGMGTELASSFPEARAVFDEVDEAIGQNLSRLMREGPEDELTLTENAQPAIMAVSLAVMRVLNEAMGFDLAANVRFVAGHSLGEYSALAAASAIDVADTARLLRARGLAMQRAVPVGEGAMAAVLGIDLDAALQVAEQAADGQVCEVANDNAPGQVVLSGHREAVERAMEIAKSHRARRCVLLPVSAPFHCALMGPAADVMAQELAQVRINAPVVPLVANVLAGPISQPDEIRLRLVEQVTGTVRWRESVEFMASEGVGVVYEIGAGRVLSGLARRIVHELDTRAIATPEEVELAAHAFAGAITS